MKYSINFEALCKYYFYIIVVKALKICLLNELN